MNEIQRQHPLYIIHAISKYLLLLLLPLLRSLMLLRGDVLAWVKGTWFDILVLMLILGVGFCQWFAARYELREKGIFVESGVLVHTSRYIPYKNLSSMVMEDPFYLRPLHLVRLRLETDSGSIRRPDVTLFLREKQYQNILSAGEAHLTAEKINPDTVRIYRPRALYIALLSLVTSNTLTGVLFASTFLSQSGKVLGEQFEQMLVDSFTKIVQILAFDVPPAAAMAAAVLMGGWALAFIINLVGNLCFRARREGHLLTIRVGVLTRRQYDLAVERINYIRLRQNLVTKLCGFCSAFLNCTGYGKAKNELAVLMPAADEAELRHDIRRILPEFRISGRKYQPHRLTIRRFLFPPVMTILSLLAGFAILYVISPSFQRTTLYFGIMAELPAVWWLLVKIAAYFHVGIGVRDDMYTFRYTFGYAFFTVVLHKDRIARIEVRQSLFQKKTQCADVIVCTFSERNDRFRVQNIHIEDVEEFLRIFH